MWAYPASERERVRELLGEPSVKTRAPEAQAKPVGFCPDLLKHAGIENVKCWASKQLAATALCALLAAPLVLILGLRWAAALPLIPLALQFIKLKRAARQRSSNFERDYPVLLVSLTTAVRTGIDPLVALLNAYELFEDKSELRREIEHLRRLSEQGVSEDALILEFAQSIDHPDIKLFRTAFSLARKQGSSLGECLQRLVRITRQRQSFRRKIKAALAMQRLSSVGIAVCAVLIGVMQFIANPAGVRSTMEHPFGSKALLLGGGLILFGLVWMTRIARSKV
jgi:tight adherence protein B